jgi:hypothetical protein
MVWSHCQRVSVRNKCQPYDSITEIEIRKDGLANSLPLEVVASRKPESGRLKIGHRLGDVDAKAVRPVVRGHYVSESSVILRADWEERKKNQHILVSRWHEREHRKVRVPACAVNVDPEGVLDVCGRLVGLE